MRGRVPVDVAEEALVPAVLHLDGPTGAQRQEAGVDLEADVLAGAERPADAAEGEAHLVLGQAEAGGDLLAVLVQPLRGDEQLDARAARVGQRQRRLEAEEGLVLHPDLVGALHHHVAGGVGSPRTIRWWRWRLPSGWIGAWPPAMATSGSVSGSSTS